MLNGVTDRPKDTTIEQHKELIDNYCSNAGSIDSGITDTELQEMEEKTHRQLRIHELVVEHSSNAALIVMSLPMPRKVSLNF